MIVDEIDLISQIGEVDPLSEEAILNAEAILQHAIADARTARPVRVGLRGGLVGGSRRVHRYLAAVAGVAAAAVVFAAALGASGTAHRSPSSPPDSPGHPAGSTEAAQATLRLASYSFQLPTGYRTVGNACLTPKSGVEAWLWTRGQVPFAAAASGRGGDCIEALLVAGDAATVPNGAHATHVGRYRGFEVSPAADTIVLYVEVSAANGHHGLVLLARGLSAVRVVAVAESGLRSPIGPATSCTSGCG